TSERTTGSAPSRGRLLPGAHDAHGLAVALNLELAGRDDSLAGPQALDDLDTPATALAGAHLGSEGPAVLDPVDEALDALGHQRLLGHHDRARTLGQRQRCLGEHATAQRAVRVGQPAPDD